MSGPPFPSAQEVLGILAAEHSPFEGPAVHGRARYCRACTVGTVVLWPCRVHTVATQMTSDLQERGAKHADQSKYDGR